MPMLSRSMQTDHKHMSLSIYAAGLAGIARGMQGIQRAAHTVASSAVDGFDLAGVSRALIDAKQHRLGIEASAKVVGHADRALGYLIDELV